MEIETKFIKINWKYRVLFAICTGLLYGFTLWLFDYFSDENIYSTNNIIFQALFFGLFFGIGFPYINQKLADKFSNKMGHTIKPDLSPDETVEVEGPANLFRGMEGVGGKIFLTNKKLIFKSHKINIQTGQTDVAYADIDQIINRKTAKLINNGIRIVTKDGKQFDFVVNERAVWLHHFNNHLK